MSLTPDMIRPLLLVCAVICLCCVLYYYNDLKGSAVIVRSPLPSSSQVRTLFKSIAEFPGSQQTVVNIMQNGKYALSGENFTFDCHVHPINFETIDNVMKLAQRTAKRSRKAPWHGYIRVLRYGEELSKQMRVFLALSHFPGFEDMKIVEPSFGYGIMGGIGPTPFHVLYNLDQLNKMFADNGYPPIVSEKEYEEVCKDSEPIYIFCFLRRGFSGRFVGDSERVQKKLYGTGKGERWVDCDENKVSLRRISRHINATARKMLCTTEHFNISTLKQTVLRNVKCVEVAVWYDHGLARLNKNMGPDVLHADDIFHYLLNPSDMIMNEARAFTEKFLERPYVAIHIRANHINNLPTTVDRCFTLAMRIVAALKERRGVKSVYLSTDMTKYGGVGSFEPGHEEYLARIGGAVRYTANATGMLKEISRTSVSLLNVVLLSKGDHLIAMGHGSFHGYVIGRFLKEHFGIDPKTWSLIKMCENARGRYQKPTKIYT